VQKYKQQLVLAVYVDDVHMAGRKENLAPMQEKLRSYMHV